MLQRYRINNCADIAEDGGGYCLSEDVAELEKSKWISVDDENPSEEYENLLVKLDGRIITGAYFINDEFLPTAVVAVDKTNDVLDVKVDFTMKVTHWQNLS